MNRVWSAADGAPTWLYVASMVQYSDYSTAFCSAAFPLQLYTTTCTLSVYLVAALLAASALQCSQTQRKADLTKMEMEQEPRKFCLSWKEFPSVYNKEFDVMRKEENFFDLTLVCDNESQFSVHKLVLSAASLFFKGLLSRVVQHQHPLIFLSGVAARDLQSILDFIYSGETEVAEKDLQSLLETAKNLKIKGLSESKVEKEEDGKSPEMAEEESLSQQEQSSRGGSTVLRPILEQTEPALDLVKEERLAEELSEPETEYNNYSSEPIDVSSFLSAEQPQQFLSEAPEAGEHLTGEESAVTPRKRRPRGEGIPIDPELDRQVP